MVINQLVIGNTQISICDDAIAETQEDIDAILTRIAMFAREGGG